MPHARSRALAALALATLVALGACTRGPAAAPAARAAPAAPAPAAPVIDDTTALAAHDAKAYRTCADQFATLAERATIAKARQLALYRAAGCRALGGEADAAFAALDRAVRAGLRDRAQLDEGADLASLRADPRWAPLVASVQAASDARERAIAQPALRTELLARYQEDQKTVKALIGHDGDAALLAAADAVVRADTARLEEIVATYGWPGASLVGEDGANAAWMLVQHADKDRAFQKRCLALMEPLVATDEVDAADYAYLYDRVAVADSRPQRYGTQFDAHREPRPIEDADHVDARRLAIGMRSMTAYRAMMLKMYGPPKP